MRYYILLEEKLQMEDFPEFMKKRENSIDPKLQSNGIKGWIYDGIEGKQIAYWRCEIDGTSQELIVLLFPFEV